MVMMKTNENVLWMEIQIVGADHKPLQHTFDRLESNKNVTCTVRPVIQEPTRMIVIIRSRLRKNELRSSISLTPRTIEALDEKLNWIGVENGCL